MAKRGFLGFLLGGVVGAGLGVVAGMLFAPRSGAESRAMAADAVNDAWDSAVDTYERSTQTVNSAVAERVAAVRGQAEDSGAADDLRAKVDLAREKMEEIRANLSDQVSSSAAAVGDAVSSVVDTVAAATEGNTTEIPAEAVEVEVAEEAAAEAAEATEATEPAAEEPAQAAEEAAAEATEAAE